MHLHDFILSQKDQWSLGNDVLYRLCKEHPHHKTNQEINAKIWLIGRSYAASIERRKNRNHINDDFYAEVVIPKIQKSHIDQWILAAKTKGSRDAVLQCHKQVTELFKEISGLEKRSLASKYLHFHVPDLFFIYDSRVATSITSFLKELSVGSKRTSKANVTGDKTYEQFYDKCVTAVREVRSKFGISLTPRQLDTVLIALANRRIRI